MKCLHVSILVLSLLMAVFRVEGQEGESWGGVIIPGIAVAAIGAGWLTKKLVNAYRDTILVWAIENHIPRIIIEKMIALGANVNASDYSIPLIGSATPLFDAESYDVSPLNVAVGTGRPEVASLLIDKGANVNAIDSFQRAPLYRAAYKGNPEVASLLIDKGANVNAIDSFQRAPLYRAVYQGNPEVASLLIDKGANVNAIDSFQQTLLHWAAYKGNPEVARLLIDKGADVHALSRSGTSALREALGLVMPANERIRRGRKEVAQLLLEWGADERVGMNPALNEEEQRTLAEIKRRIKQKQAEIGEVVAETVPGLPTDVADLIATH